MDFSLTTEQEMIRKTVRNFAEKVIKPRVKERDESGEFPAEAIKGLGDLGFLGAIIPEEWGGAGLDAISYAILIEELARVCPSTAVTVSVTNSVCGEPILRFGTKEQKKKYLFPLAKGEIIGGFALTEPGAGSDAAAIATRAERKEDFYILNGSKAWITNTHVGGVFVVMAVTNAEAGPKGVSAFIVEPAFEGFSFLPVENKMGLRASKTSGISFYNCRIPSSCLLGKEGDGLNIALSTLDNSRIGIAAQAIGIAQGAYEEAVNYAASRKAFGMALSEIEAIQFMLADMATEIEAGRLLTYRAAATRDKTNRKELGLQSAIAKLFSSESAKAICDWAVQIHGAYGFSRDYPVERFYRDVRVTTIYEGTSEIQRIVIARALLS